ncbi:MAG: beta-N-acetylhexosaminidase [Solirubrobacteraceae bacterium]|nr:beta-N-acetylhexosaminidase [Solirubrobacteraceae bacterium]
MTLRLPARRGRAWRVVLAGVFGLLVLGSAATAVLVGESGSQKPLSAHERAARAAAAPVRRAAAGMSLPVAVAQVFIVGTDAQFPRDPFFAELRGRGWGAVVLGPGKVVDSGQARELAGEIGVVSRQAKFIAPLVAAEQSGGDASTFTDLPPRAQTLAGDLGRPAAARSDARAAARALRELGVRMTLAPVADVGAAAGPLQDRVFSDDPAVVVRLTRAAVEGWRSGGVIPAVGHFPGQGAASEDPDTANATVGLSLADLRSRDLRPFAAVARRAPVIQLSNAVYAAYDGVTPATVLPDVARLLRHDLHYRGVVMTADLAATAPVLGTGVGTAAVQALRAGADLLYVSGGPAQQEAAYRAVLRAVRTKRISRDRLMQSVRRVLALKRSAGLLPAARPRR